MDDYLETSPAAMKQVKQVEFNVRSGLLVVCNPQTLARDHVSWLLGFKKVLWRILQVQVAFWFCGDPTV